MGARHGQVGEGVGVEQEDQLADHARQGVAEQLPHEDGRDDDAESERLRQHVEAICAPDGDGSDLVRVSRARARVRVRVRGRGRVRTRTLTLTPTPTLTLTLTR